MTQYKLALNRQERFIPLISFAPVQNREYLLQLLKSIYRAHNRTSTEVKIPLTTLGNTAFAVGFGARPYPGLTVIKFDELHIVARETVTGAIFGFVS